MRVIVPPSGITMIKSPTLQTGEEGPSPSKWMLKSLPTPQIPWKIILAAFALGYSYPQSSSSVGKGAKLDIPENPKVQV